MDTIRFVGLGAWRGSLRAPSGERAVAFALSPDRAVIAQPINGRGSNGAPVQSASPADGILVDWAKAQAVAPGSIVAVGWHPEVLDSVWLHTFLPRFAAYLHPKAVDLAGCFYLVAGARSYLGTRLDHTGWEKVARTVAHYEVVNRRGTVVDPTSPTDSATVALLTWNWIRTVLAMPSAEVALFRGDGIDAGGGFAMAPLA